MRRLFAASIVLVVLAAVSPAAAGPRPLSDPDDGLLSDIPRAQFVRNVKLGRVARTSAPPVVPATKVADGNPSEWEAGTEPTRLGGQTTLQAGQLLYEDWILDDTGTARSCVVERRDRNAPVEDALGWSKYQALDSALGEEVIPIADVAGVFDQPQTECEKGIERYGDARYPDGTLEGSADLLELRVAADADRVSFLIRLNAMTPGDTPVVAVAIDADGDPITGPGQWGFSSGVATPGADHVLTITRDALRLDGGPAPAGAAVAANDLGAGGPANPGGFGGLIEASVPLTSLRKVDKQGQPITGWRLWAGTGLWDGTGWRAPKAGEDGPRVLNLAFRGEAEPLRPFMDEQQAFELRRAWNASPGTARLSDRFTARIDVAKLAAGSHETWELAPGYYVRTFLSRVTDGQVNGSCNACTPEAGPRSARQPYGLFVPKTYIPGLAQPMTLWLHWRGPGDHQAAYYVPNLFHELGEQRGNVIVSPRGRGSSGWYVGDSQVDVLDALADAQDAVGADPDRLYVAGYSMGGWGAYLLSMLYPDRFAGAFSIVGPPAIGAWPYPAAPTAPQNNRPLYFTNPIVGNARSVPTVIFHGTNDELVPVSGTTRQADTYRANQQPYRYYLFPGYEHFTFALADEWSKGADYLGNRRRTARPHRVTYARMPCLEPAKWSPLYGGPVDGAYWVDGIQLASPPSGCTSRETPTEELWRTGSVDVEVDTAFTGPRRPGPEADAGGPPGHTGGYVMTGYDPDLPVGVPRNQYWITARGVTSFRIDVPGSGLDTSGNRAFLFVNTERSVTIHLDGLTATEWKLDSNTPVPFEGSVTIPPGHHFVTLFL